VIALVKTGEAFMAMTNQALRHHRLSAAGRQALAILEGAGEPLSPTTIAERLIVTTATVTSLLDTLEKRGLLVRQADTSDRRKLLISITDEGRTIVDAFLPEIIALQTAVMAKLSEPQRRQLLRSLAVVREGIATIEAEAIVAAAPKRGRPRQG
jgi:DNA-binding MarR family transcriptional regulator